MTRINWETVMLIESNGAVVILTYTRAMPPQTVLVLDQAQNRRGREPCWKSPGGRIEINDYEHMEELIGVIGLSDSDRRKVLDMHRGQCEATIAALWELYEETGLKTDLDHLVYRGREERANPDGVGTHPLYKFRADVTGQLEYIARAGHENECVSVFDIDEIVQAIKDPGYVLHGVDAMGVDLAAQFFPPHRRLWIEELKPQRHAA